MNPTVREAENSWIEKARKGDDDAFANLVDAYQGPVFNLCYRMLGNREEAEDAAQETFLKAYRALNRYDSSRKFVNWILAIASNHCIDRIRRRRLQLFSFEDVVPLEDHKSTKPEAAVFESEYKKEVQELVGQLDQKDRAAVILRYWYDMSYDEIADSLDLTVSAVKSRLHRARKRMADCWMETQVVENISQGREHETSYI
ncbi:MAG: sigma-70 family RNA polymerase sigma factor [Anaerolineales bacterium]|nr:sigma-70 family RNA polymerase sigma factor [Anaerolineales bacterium]